MNKRQPSKSKNTNKNFRNTRRAAAVGRQPRAKLQLKHHQRKVLLRKHRPRKELKQLNHRTKTMTTMMKTTMKMKIKCSKTSSENKEFSCLSFSLSFFFFCVLFVVEWHICMYELVCAYLSIFFVNSSLFVCVCVY